MIKVEYMIGAETAMEPLLLAGLVKELGVQHGGVQFHCNSLSVI